MTNNTYDVCQAFVCWLGKQRGYEEDPENYLVDDPEIDGVPIEQSELKKAIDLAEHRTLVTTFSGGFGADLPASVRLLPAGHECLEEFDGDVRRWNEAQRGSSTVSYDYSVRVSAGNHVQVVAHAQEAVQNMTVSTIDTAALREVGKAAQEIVDVLPRPLRDDVSEAGKALVRAADVADVDQTKSAARKLLDLLTASSASLTVVRFVIDALTQGLGGQ